MQLPQREVLQACLVLKEIEKKLKQRAKVVHFKLLKVDCAAAPIDLCTSWRHKHQWMSPKLLVIKSLPGGAAVQPKYSFFFFLKGLNASTLIRLIAQLAVMSLLKLLKKTP